MGQEGSHGSTTEVSAEYKHEAVATLDTPGTVIAAELGIGRRCWDGGDVNCAVIRVESKRAPSGVGPGDAGAGRFARSGWEFNRSMQHGPVVYPPAFHIPILFSAADSTSAQSCWAQFANVPTDLCH
jgi:hypothetical protein